MAHRRKSSARRLKLPLFPESGLSTDKGQRGPELPWQTRPECPSASAPYVGGPADDARRNNHASMCSFSPSARHIERKPCGRATSEKRLPGIEGRLPQRTNDTLYFHIALCLERPTCAERFQLLSLECTTRSLWQIQSGSSSVARPKSPTASYDPSGEATATSFRARLRRELLSLSYSLF